MYRATKSILPVSTWGESWSNVRAILRLTSANKTPGALCRFRFEGFQYYYNQTEAADHLRLNREIKFDLTWQFQGIPIERIPERKGYFVRRGQIEKSLPRTRRRRRQWCPHTCNWPIGPYNFLMRQPWLIPALSEHVELLVTILVSR